MTGNDMSEIFPGNSEMAAEMRAHDWAATSLGDPAHWPEALKIPLRMLLTSRSEMWIGWGDDLLFFYNDAYIPTLGIKHPAMLGQPFREVWSEVYDEVADQVDRVRAGEATWNEGMLLLLERSGQPEETYHSFSYSPLHQSDASVGGLLCTVSEDTRSVIGERRLETLRDLGSMLVGTSDLAEVRNAVDQVFARNRRDFPFIALRLATDEAAAADATANDAFSALSVDLLEAASREGAVIALPRNASWPSGEWGRPPEHAIIIGIPGLADQPSAGELLLGLNPYRSRDDDLIEIARVIASQISSAVANVTARERERRLADQIWKSSRDLIVVVDGKGVFRSVNPAWTRILGHAVEDVVGRPFSDFMHPDDVAPSHDALEAALGDQQLNDYANRFRTSDGDYRRIEWHTNTEGGLVYAYGRDVTERQRAEVALNESQEQFRHLVQGVTDYAIYMLDLEGHVSSWNEGARRIKQYEPEEIIGEHFSRFYTDQDRANDEPVRALETARREGRFAAEGWRVRKGGQRFRASVVIDAIRNDEGVPIGFAKITRDITEREEAQRQLEQAREALFQSQKMDAIGQLTGGIAHDFNNLLMAVLSSLELLRKRLSDDPMAERLLNNALQGAQRGATLTQRMLAFARRQELKVDRVDLTDLLENMNDLVQRSIGPEWPISTTFPLKIPNVRADANQLEMALLNLIVNARDATPGGGPIRISATREDISARIGDIVPNGNYVRLVVADSGTGMDADTLRRATEPFFTTKGVGKGTGLGLPMVHGMAQQIGGAFELQSAAGTGTSAILWLPIAEQEVAGEPPEAADDHLQATAQLRILAVDDDALVLLNTAALLEDLGHQVVEASSVDEALEQFGDGHLFDLVVTDQAMPNRTGTELIAAIDAIRPGLPAIIASGYGEGVEAGRPVIRLGKPFNQVRLASAIADAIAK